MKPVREPSGVLFLVKADSGEVPAVLKGRYTHFEIAQRAIDLFQAGIREKIKREKAEKEAIALAAEETRKAARLEAARLEGEKLKAEAKAAKTAKIKAARKAKQDREKKVAPPESIDGI